MNDSLLVSSFISSPHKPLMICLSNFSGSGSTLFDVLGSQGQLFSITDDLTGTLFTVSDISGLPILQVDDK